MASSADGPVRLLYQTDRLSEARVRLEEVVHRYPDAPFNCECVTCWPPRAGSSRGCHQGRGQRSRAAVGRRQRTGYDLG